MEAFVEQLGVDRGRGLVDVLVAVEHPAQLLALDLGQRPGLAGGDALGPRWERGPAVPAVVPSPRLPEDPARLARAEDRHQLAHGCVDHLVSPGSARRCRWRAAPTAPRAFPGPRSPCEPCPARRGGARSRAEAWLCRGLGGLRPGARRACPARPGRPYRPACATRTEASCRGPPGAAAPPCRPWTAPRTPRGSASCRRRRTAAWAGPARGPRGPVRSCRPWHQHDGARHHGARLQWSFRGSFPALSAQSIDSSTCLTGG